MAGFGLGALLQRRIARMSGGIYSLIVDGLTVEVVRKAIGTLRLSVHPLDGRVRLAVPLAVGDGEIRRLIRGKLDWIQRQQARLAAQPSSAPPAMVSGENHYVLGQRYRLQIVAYDGPPRIRCDGTDILELFVRPETTATQRQQVLDTWYRAQLRQRIPALLAHWQSIMGVMTAEWGIKKMKTRWGSCNIKARRVWFNLELAKKSAPCLEYVVVHELAHLLERNHGPRFKAVMDRYLPDWRSRREALNRIPPD